MKKTTLWILASIFAVVCALTACNGNADEPKESDDSSDFVTITDVVPDVILEIRYFSTYNFVGKRIDGYLQPTALLTKRAADSLKAVSDDLVRHGYRLKIYDAYRPQCAVDHFVRWSKDVNDTLMKKYFYPDLDRNISANAADTHAVRRWTSPSSI